LEKWLDERRAGSRADLALRISRLRDAGQIPAEGRGRNVPHIEPIHAVRIVVAAALDVPARSCAPAVVEFTSLRLARSSRDQVHFADGAPTFGLALEKAFTNMRLAHLVRQVDLRAPIPKNKYLNEPLAAIEWGNSAASAYVPNGSEASVDLHASHSKGMMRRSIIIDGELIRAIASSLEKFPDSSPLPRRAPG